MMQQNNMLESNSASRLIAFPAGTWPVVTAVHAAKGRGPFNRPWQSGVLAIALL
jgi:hypothetical protein